MVTVCAVHALCWCICPTFWSHDQASHCECLTDTHIHTHSYVQVTCCVLLWFMAVLGAIFSPLPEGFIINVCVWKREKQMEPSSELFPATRTVHVWGHSEGYSAPFGCCSHMSCAESHTGRVWHGSSYWLSAVAVTTCFRFTTTNRLQEVTLSFWPQSDTQHFSTPSLYTCIREDNLDVPKSQKPDVKMS